LSKIAHNSGSTETSAEAEAARMSDACMDAKPAELAQLLQPPPSYISRLRTAGTTDQPAITL